MFCITLFFPVLPSLSSRPLAYPSPRPTPQKRREKWPGAGWTRPRMTLFRIRSTASPSSRCGSLRKRAVDKPTPLRWPAFAEFISGAKIKVCKAVRSSCRLQERPRCSWFDVRVRPRWFVPEVIRCCCLLRMHGVCSVALDHSL